MKNLPFRIFGETQAERDRVLEYLSNDRPELNVEYMEKYGKRFSNNKPARTDEFVLDPETLDQSFRFIQFFLNRK